MAAFGIMAALHERERSGEGQLVDVSMTDGALSWLAMVAAQYLCDGRVPQRGEEMLNGGVACYLPYEAADGWVSCGALEPKFWQAFCAGVERPDLLEHQFAKPGSDGHAQVAEVFRGRSRDEWAAFNDEHDCCIEPILDLDEALDSELVRAREMVVERRPARARRGAPARPPGEALAHRRRPDPAGAGARRAHRGRPRATPGIDGDELAELLESGAVAGPNEAADQAQFLVMSAPAKELLKISELAERSEVPVATIRHYLREGLLPEPVKTSRNMAYYPPEFVERIRLIKQLQEERYMPLRVIREVLDSADGDLERLRSVVESGDSLLAQALAPLAERVPEARGARALRLPRAGAAPARGARRPEPRRARLQPRRGADHRRDLALSRRRLERDDRLRRPRRRPPDERARAGDRRRARAPARALRRRSTPTAPPSCSTAARRRFPT